MAKVDVTRTDEDDRGYSFDVRVSEARTGHDYQVTLSNADHAQLAGASESPEDFVRRCFEYLLHREPAGSILSRFDIRVIENYFPNFRQEIRRPAR